MHLLMILRGGKFKSVLAIDMQTGGQQATRAEERGTVLPRSTLPEQWTQRNGLQ